MRTAKLTKGSEPSSTDGSEGTRVDRAELLRKLEAVSHGLSPRDIVEQSASFILQNGEVLTFNDEVCCRSISGLPDSFTGAVPHDPLLDVLRKLKEDTLQVEAVEGGLELHGKGRKVHVRMEAEILLPVDKVERPKSWSSLHKDFLEALNIVQSCAGKDESRFERVCIHIHPKWLEASDNTQMARFSLKTGFKEPVLVRRDAARPLVQLGVTEFAESDAWVHFRGPDLEYSIRRHHADYPDLTKILDVEGEEASLPKGLADAADLASVFIEKDDLVTVELKPGRVKVKGEGPKGWYSESKKAAYQGSPIAFRIAPSLLAEIVKRHDQCIIREGRLKVDGGKWAYVTSLGIPEGKE